ncbi:unnamed protein product [Notodromas monacha]|uniref:E3 ubiquitin-protein ligase Msl2 zinc RING finger domain-containing protein n=1 Tax=Notodromas monacha TaxID=399045 RepID=A0A7R9BUY2_9CRUS|nr:unnamed protein product [Notodromas monacha]CAG0921114.1 unnamed protein product [Notodromas monacha]
MTEAAVPTNATRWMLATTGALRRAVVADSGDNCWMDFLQLMVSFRESLACTVCKGIVCEAKYPVPDSGGHDCQHHVCSHCLGSKKILKPSCSWCRDYDLYVDCACLDSHVRVYRGIFKYCVSLRQFQSVKSKSFDSRRTLLTLPENLQPLSLETLLKEVQQAEKYDVMALEVHLDTDDDFQAFQQEPILNEGNYFHEGKLDGKGNYSPSRFSEEEEEEDLEQESEEEVIQQQMHVMREIIISPIPQNVKSLKRKLRPIVRQNCK